MKNHNCPHKDKPHGTKGMCNSCYIMVRYYFEPEFKKRLANSMQKYQKTHREELTKKVIEWQRANPEKVKEYRKKYRKTDKYHYTVAKNHFKKLSKKDKLRLISEVG